MRSTKRFCPRCLRRSAVSISYGLPVFGPDRVVTTPRGNVQIYDSDGPWVGGGCVQITAMPGVAQGLRFRWDRYRNPGSGSRSFSHCCMRCGRLQGLNQEKRRQPA